MPKIDCYGWAGVNTTKNPIQLENNELTKAQNAFRDAAGEHGGLRKRPGLTKINSTAMSGEILGFINVPINAITLRKFLISVGASWIASTDQFATTTGTATVPGAAPAVALSQGTFFGTIGSTMLNKGTQSEDLFIYPGDHAAGAVWPIRIWDGSVDSLLFTIPPNASALAEEGADYFVPPTTPGTSPYDSQVCQLLLVGTKLYIVIVDMVELPPPSFSRILEYDFDTNVLKQIGQGTGNLAGEIGDGAVNFRSIAHFQGDLYAGVGSVNTGSNSNDAGIWRFRPGVDTVWTRELSLESGAVGEIPNFLEVYKGKLYAGLQDYDSGTQRLLVRAADATWSQSTSVGTNVQSGWLTAKVFGENLYATSIDVTAGDDITRIHKFDNTTWSVVKTIETAADPRMGVAMVVHQDRLYVLCVNAAGVGLVTHTADGTVWTDITSNLGANVSSVFGVLAT